MEKIRHTINAIVNGYADNVRDDFIDNNTASNIVNYEEYKTGELTKTGSWEDILDTELSAYISANAITIKKFLVWYPTFLIEGQSTTTKIVYLVLDNSSVWHVIFYTDADDGTLDDEEVSNPTIQYVNYNDINLFISNDRILIADGYNNVHNLRISSDGTLSLEKIGLDCPKTILSQYESTTYNEYVSAESADIGMGIEKGAIIQYAYTYVLDTGEESNPSPITTLSSVTYQDREYVTEEDAKTFKYYWKQTAVSNFVLPSAISEYIDGKVKEFKVYRRHNLYCQEAGLGDFYYVGSLPYGADHTNNTIFYDTYSSSSEAISYDNAVAPIAKDVCMMNGIAFCGNVKTNISFPIDYDKYFKIEINNTNTREYINARIVIKLLPADMGLTTFEGHSFGDGARIFFSDMTTPLPVSYQNLNTHIYLYVIVPHIQANVTTTLYFTYAEDVTPTLPEDWDTYTYYGLFSDDTVDPENLLDEHFTPLENPRSSDHVLCTDWAEIWSSTYIHNKYNNDDYYNFNGATWTLTEHSEIAFFLDADDTPVTIETVAAVQSGSPDINTWGRLYGNSPIQERNTVWGWFKVNYTTINEDVSTNNCTLLSLCTGTNGYNTRKISLTVQKTTTELVNSFKWRLLEDTTTTYTSLLSGDDESVAEDDQYYFCMLSWDNELKKAYAFVYNKETGIIVNSEKTVTELTLSTNFGVRAYQTHTLINAFANTYINDDDIAMQFLRFVPYMPNSYIGWNGAANSNITFSDIKDIRQESYPKMLRWSGLNVDGFPVLNYVNASFEIERIIPAPSFLLQQYQSTIVIFSKNGVERFVIVSDGNGGIDSSIINLIPEQSNIGLYADRSLVNIGKSLFWVSANGAVMWDGGGLRRISNTLDVNIPSYAIGFFDSKMNQYCIYYSEDGEQGLSVILLSAYTLYMDSDSTTPEKTIIPRSILTFDSFLWDFDEETTPISSPATSTDPTPRVIYTKIGKFKYTVSAVKDGTTYTAYNHITVKPVANFSWTPFSPKVGEPVTFTCESFSDNITSRVWSFGVSATIIDDSDEANPIVSFSIADDMPVTLNISCNGLNAGVMYASSMKEVTVSAEAPLARYSGVGANYVDTNVDYEEDNTVQIDTDLNGTQYFWFAYPAKYGRANFYHDDNQFTVPYSVVTIDGVPYYVHRSMYAIYKDGTGHIIETLSQE